MKMAPKTQRLWLAVIGMMLMAGGVFLILTTFQANLVFFVTPTDLLKTAAASDKPVRLGGLVKEGSVKHSADNLLTFIITDTQSDIPVQFRGAPPALFRESQGVVAEGRMGKDGHFEASRVLAKHDENYMPPEVAEALKKAGYWQKGYGSKAAP